MIFLPTGLFDLIFGVIECDPLGLASAGLESHG